MVSVAAYSVGGSASAVRAGGACATSTHSKVMCAAKKSTDANHKEEKVGSPRNSS